MSTLDEIKEDLINLRDDAPVYPLWTIGDIKALVAEARIDEVHLAISDFHVVTRTKDNYLTFLKGRLKQLMENK